MCAIWRNKGMFNITEQRLMDQQSQIIKKQWFKKLEVEKYRKKNRRRTT